MINSGMISASNGDVEIRVYYDATQPAGPHPTAHQRAARVVAWTW